MQASNFLARPCHAGPEVNFLLDIGPVTRRPATMDNETRVIGVCGSSGGLVKGLVSRGGV